MAITHIQLMSVPVSDQDRAKSFYVDTLGMSVLREGDMPGLGRWLQVVPKGADTSITLVTWFDSMPAGSLRGLVLESDDLDRDAAELTDRGVAFENGIEQAPWGRFARFADPDGNGLILQTTTAPN